MEAENIKEYRKRHNLTQEGLAEIVGTSVRAVQSWEQGQRNITQGAIKLMELYEVQDRSISIGGDNNGVANTGKIAGDVIYNNETVSDNTKDINALFTNYNDNKGIEIDRLQALYATILSEKNEVIRELKEVIKDLREDKKQLTNIIENNNRN